MSKKKDSFKLLFVDISKQSKELNKHSIWLLIATIGCWGIPSSIAQPIAMFLVFFISVYPLESLIKQKTKNYFKRYNVIKNMYGQYLTVNRLRLVRRKMRQHVVQQIRISVLCLIFVFLSFLLIGIKFGRELAITHESGKILEFFLSW